MNFRDCISLKFIRPSFKTHLDVNPMIGDSLIAIPSDSEIRTDSTGDCLVE